MGSVVGGFSTTRYWSSLELSATSARSVYFGVGSPVNDKPAFNYVRAIRA